MDIRKNAVAGILVEFLEVAIHSILYLRSLYPDTIFVKQRKYGIGVYKCTHPQLCTYITDSMKCAHELLKKKALHSVVLMFINKESRPVERYVFDYTEKSQDISVNDIYMLQVEERLRACCLKLQARCSSMDPLSSSHNFAIQIQTTESGAVQLSCNPHFEHFPWIETENSEVIVEDGKLLPIRTADTHSFKLQVYLIEADTCL